MKDVEGKVAVVTGAASGIGRGIAQALADARMKVVLADIETTALATTEKELSAAGADVLAVITDVSKLESVQALAVTAEEHYGTVHVLCNNAGIGVGNGPLWESTIQDWEWIRGVNLDSVLHGIRVFVPKMIAHGEGAHVVNTASMAGLLPAGDGGLYSATKFAVVSLSETLYLQLRLARASVSVSVLCPGWVNTNIAQSQRNRPGGPLAVDAAGSDPRRDAMRGWVERQIKEGIDPRDVGRQVLDAVLADKFYILTHPTWAPLVAARMQRIVAGESPQPAAVPGVESLMEKLGPR